MNKYIFPAVAALSLILSAASCDDKKQSSDQSTQLQAETRTLAPSPFSADSAYMHIEKQLSFGPRVPNTEGHRATAEYLVSQLERVGLRVIQQRATLKAYDATELDAVNIIASYKPEAEKRIMLFAHWDTRPYADKESNATLRNTPIPGADDGASGTGVLLEMARILSEKGLDNIGVDIMLFDAEDYGLPHWETDYDTSSEETWALGTQHWTQHPHVEGYAPMFGILLDMVGAKDATFHREFFSQESAGNRVTDIWRTAAELGHQKYFINKMGGAITDDHYFVIRNLRIPCVDIINYKDDFPSYWHTHNDNLDNISKETLSAVGETIWQLLLDIDQGHIK